MTTKEVMLDKFFMRPDYTAKEKVGMYWAILYDEPVEKPTISSRLRPLLKFALEAVQTACSMAGIELEHHEEQYNFEI